MPTSTNATRLGLLTYLVLVLVPPVLKLAHLVAWPWRWVTVPLWGPWALLVLLLALTLLRRLVWPRRG